MDANYSLSEAEQGVLSTARGLLGPNLADYLLSGLGETQVTSRRTFTTSGPAQQGGEVPYQFEMSSDSAQGLPIGHDPLVMAVLIGLLRERQPMDETITFGMDDMLKILQWPQGKESKLMVTRAVERYAATTYCLIDQPLPEEARSSRFRRLVIGFEVVSKPAAGKRGASKVTIKVQFWPYFINAFILHGRKHFLGIEFHGLGKVHLIPG